MFNTITKLTSLVFLFFFTTIQALAAPDQNYLKQLETEASSNTAKSDDTSLDPRNEAPVETKAVDKEVARLITTVKEIKQDPKKLERAKYDGQNRAVLCIHCHGKDGNSIRPNIPNLATQTPEYLLTQFEQFSRGKRKNTTMQQLAGTLTPDDKVNIAIYFSAMTVKPVPRDVKPLLYDKGKRIYASNCAKCHGNRAHGNHQMPYLAGQKKDYLIHTLNLLRKADKSRSNSPMVPVAELLTEDDILSVAEYLSVLN